MNCSRVVQTLNVLDKMKKVNVGQIDFHGDRKASKFQLTSAWCLMLDISIHEFNIIIICMFASRLSKIVTLKRIKNSNVHLFNGNIFKLNDIIRYEQLATSFHRFKFKRTNTSTTVEIVWACAMRSPHFACRLHLNKRASPSNPRNRTPMSVNLWFGAQVKQQQHQ